MSYGKADLRVAGDAGQHLVALLVSGDLLPKASHDLRGRSCDAGEGARGVYGQPPAAAAIPASLEATCIAPPPSQVPPDLGGPDGVASPTIATPYSDQISLGWSWQATDWLGLNFEAVSIDYHDIPFRFRPNVVTEDGARRFPAGNFRMWHGGGRGSYDGFNIGARVRQEKWELQGFYTYSEAESNVLGGVDEFRLTGTDFQADTGGSRLRRDQSVNPSNGSLDTVFYFVGINRWMLWVHDHEDRCL